MNHDRNAWRATSNWTGRTPRTSQEAFPRAAAWRQQAHPRRTFPALWALIFVLAAIIVYAS